MENITTSSKDLGVWLAPCSRPRPSEHLFFMCASCCSQFVSIMHGVGIQFKGSSVDPLIIKLSNMGLDLQPNGLTAGLAGHCQPDKRISIVSERKRSLQCKSYQYNQQIVLRISLSYSTFNESF